MRIPLFTLAGSLALAACGDDPAAPKELNNSANDTVPVNVATPPPVAPHVANVVDTPAPSLDFDDEAQMRDDADASGLTARLPREGDDAARNAAAPRR